MPFENEYIVDVTAVGVKYNVVASKTFPNGFVIDELADDSDPFDFPDADIAEYGIGLNGSLVVWNKAVALPMSLNVIPTTSADRNLMTLYNANRRTKDHQPAGDIVTITAIYPNGEKRTLMNGIIMTGSAMKSISANARFKTRTYGFVFQNVQ